MKAVDYQTLANTHRPRSTEAIRAAIDDLYAQGLKARDISAALRVPLDVVINFLFEEGINKCN